MARASVELGLTDPVRPAFTRRPALGGSPADAQTVPLERAAAQLDEAVAIAEVYRSDPTWLAPEEVWAGLQKACPDLLGPP